MPSQQKDFIKSLGLPANVLTDQVEYIHFVREGVPGKVVKMALEVLGNRDLIVRILGTSSSNLSRYYKIKKMNRVDSEEMLDTLRLYSQAVSTFGDIEKAKHWIDTPLPALSGEKPEEMFDTFEGRNWVSRILRKIEYGEFV